MLFISAQPDQYYFLWQLELQIFNFEKLGVNLSDVHILIGFDEDQQPSRDFKAFRRKYNDLGIYIYPDTRKSKTYLSSLRPHLLAKHFEELPHLCNETLFYHDSDIVFSSLPDFALLSATDTWYTSDTRSYLDSSYILKTAGKAVFHQMCAIVGVGHETVRSNDKHAGGAQYIIKNVGAAFWKKVEHDCENVYKLLLSAEKQLNGNELFEEKPVIQKWCTDMWVLWWNALLHQRNFEIHPELRFCWADSTITEWHETNILHYTGGPVANGLYFRKGDYMLYSPFHQRFDHISTNSCSYPLVNLIKEFSRERLVKKKMLKDVSFLIPVKIDSEDRLTNIYTSTAFLEKYFHTHIIVMEVDQQQHINPTRLPPGTKYFFRKASGARLHRTQVNNNMIRMADTRFIALYDADVIIPVKQVLAAVKVLRQGEYPVVSPYNGVFFNVDVLLKEMFIRFQEDEFLEVNKFKNGVASKRSYGGCIFLDRKCYMEAGMENENLTSWGPDDIERVKRMQILGYKTQRIKGNLFHLHHQRKTDSGYQNSAEYEKLMFEYLNIAAMEKEELLNTIDKWTWTK
jgi:hypothetical protein